MSRAEIWDGDLPEETLSLETIPERYQAIFDLAASLSVSHGLFPLLQAAAAGEPETTLSTKGISPHLKAVIEAIKKNGLAPSAGSLLELIGLGPGLTPLGDDVILGILLSLNRWKRVIAPDQDQVEFNQLLLAIAKEKTSTLSYSLFSCAVEGSGDARLLVVLDSFFSGAEPTPNQMRDFLNWGSSSGVGVLAGVLAVVNSYIQNETVS